MARSVPLLLDADTGLVVDAPTVTREQTEVMIAARGAAELGDSARDPHGESPVRLNVATAIAAQPSSRLWRETSLEAPR